MELPDIAKVIILLVCILEIIFITISIYSSKNSIKRIEILMEQILNQTKVSKVSQEDQKKILSVLLKFMSDKIKEDNKNVK